MNEQSNKRVHKGWIIALSIILVLLMLISVVWYCVAPALDETGLRYLVTNAVASYGKTTTNKEVKALQKRLGGWITGVCHPDDPVSDNMSTEMGEEAIALLKDANIGWVRFDLTSLPYTYDEGGNIVETGGYKHFKERAKWYADHGIKLMCVTQYPDVFYDGGYDCREEAGKAEIRKMAAYIAEDLKGLVAALQITNEMGVDHFRELCKNEKGDPVLISYEDAAEYIGIQLEAMSEVKDHVPIGYNLAGWTIFSLMDIMKHNRTGIDFHKYCDYVALDLYCGCFENIMSDLIFYDLMLRAIWNYTRKPIILNEFGYMGAGNPHTEEERVRILQEYGYNSEAEARADIRTFFSRLPKSLQEDVKRSLRDESDKELDHWLFETDKKSHIYKEISDEYKLTKYDHTEADQGRFFTDAIARLSKLKFLCGAIVYCFGDSDACYVCGQVGCPVETGWGLVRRQKDETGRIIGYEKKASYNATKEAFAKALDKRN